MDKEDSDDPTVMHTRQYVLTSLVIVVSCLVLWFWTSISAANSQIVHGYPNIAIPTGPGVFVSTRTTVYTIMVCMIPLNFLLLMFFAAMMADPSVQELAVGHRVVAAIVLIVNIILLLWFLFSWVSVFAVFEEDVCSADKAPNLWY